jgi:nucleotide-binding universal stress UspA family protein
MISNILVAYDGSPPSERAFTSALELATAFDARLTVISILVPPDGAADVETEALLEQSRDDFIKRHVALKDMVGGLAQEIGFEILVGHPADHIVDYAGAKGCDLIVVGHRGRTFFARLVTGSVVKYVIDHAPCAVLVIR